MSEYVNANGDPINPFHTPSALAKKVRPKRDGAAEWHRGWSVEGFAPGRIAEAEAQRAKDIADWAALDDLERAKAIKEGKRHPKPWDRDDYVATSKRSRVRARPFEVVGAAHELKAMAERAGWEFVEVVELAKRKAA